MKILIVSATDKEIERFVSLNSVKAGWNHIYGHSVVVGYTGIGVAMASLKIQEYLNLYKPDIVIQAGICGAYTDSGLKVGDTVMIQSESIADLGVLHEDGMKREFVECTRLCNPDTYEYQSVAGNTVNMACSPYVEQNGSAEVESMEGYGLFLVCLHYGVKFAEMRTVSNFVSTDRSSWNLRLAVDNLAYGLSGFLENL
ncbi:MAG: hypothetical protein LIO79_05770 [Rikenellaceae bacterium]|nr:hypothetical protein [Rikenellaceae bacterium]